MRSTKETHWISRFPAKFPLNPMDLEWFSAAWSIWDNSLTLIMGTRAWTGGPLKGTEGSWRAQSLGLVNRKTSFCGPPLKPGTLHMLRVLTSQTCFDRTNKSTGFTPFLCTFLWICLSYFITSMYSWYIDTRNQPGQPKYTIWFLPITTPKRCSILRTNPSRMVVNATFSESLSSFWHWIEIVISCIFSY